MIETKKVFPTSLLSNVFTNEIHNPINTYFKGFESEIIIVVLSAVRTNWISLIQVL